MRSPQSLIIFSHSHEDRRFSFFTKVGEERPGWSSKGEVWKFKGQSYPCKGEGSQEAQGGPGTAMGNNPEAIKKLVSSPFNENYYAKNTVSIKSSCGPAVWLVSGLDLC